MALSLIVWKVFETETGKPSELVDWKVYATIVGTAIAVRLLINGSYENEPEFGQAKGMAHGHESGRGTELGLFIWAGCL